MLGRKQSNKPGQTAALNVMSTIELKQKLISKIQETVDDRLLEEALRLLDIESNESDVLVLNKEKQVEHL